MKNNILYYLWQKERTIWLEKEYSIQGNRSWIYYLNNKIWEFHIGIAWLSFHLQDRASKCSLHIHFSGDMLMGRDFLFSETWAPYLKSLEGERVLLACNSATLQHHLTEQLLKTTLKLIMPTQYWVSWSPMVTSTEVICVFIIYLFLGTCPLSYGKNQSVCPFSKKQSKAKQNKKPSED